MAFAREVMLFERARFQGWVARSEQDAKALLKQPILLEDPANGRWANLPCRTHQAQRGPEGSHTCQNSPREGDQCAHMVSIGCLLAGQAGWVVPSRQALTGHACT